MLRQSPGSVHGQSVKPCGHRRAACSTAAPVPDRDVNVVARKVHVLVNYSQPQVYCRVRVSEPAEPVHKPLRRKVRGRADGERPCGVPPQDALSSKRDVVERVAQHVQVSGACFRKAELPGPPHEQLQSQHGFESLQLMAHGALGDGKLPGAARVKLLWRAAASKALNAFSGGRRRGMRHAVGREEN